MQRARDIDRSRANPIVFVSWTFALAIALTGFYCVHEQLPRPVRAPSALILAPVAIADGLCHAANIPGIYGQLLPVFIVNCVFAAMLCGAASLVQNWRRRRKINEDSRLR